MNSVYRVNGPRVIFENIEGELILVHMERGTYYSTDEIGAELWSLIEAQSSVSDMCDVLASRYDAQPTEIADAVARFLARLMEEDLVAVGESPGAPRTTVPPVMGGKRPFSPPALQSYRDMQDMLSLDPIHDVEAAGWPVPRSDDEPSVAPAT